MHREPGHDNFERAVRIGQRGDVTAIPRDVANPTLRCVLARPVQHRRGHINPGRVFHMRREGADNDPAAARDIQHRIARRWRRRLNDHAQRVGICNRASGRLNGVACRVN